MNCNNKNQTGKLANAEKSPKGENNNEHEMCTAQNKRLLSTKMAISEHRLARVQLNGKNLNQNQTHISHQKSENKIKTENVSEAPTNQMWENQINFPWMLTSQQP